MAKAKKIEQPAFMKDIVKKYGKVISTGIEVMDKRKDYEVIPVSPAIDMSLGGGIREGSWVILTGDPKCGKTTTALQIASNCQAEGRPVVYIDAEGRLKDMNLTGVNGLDLDKVQIVQSDDEPLSAEAFLDICVKLVSAKENHRCVCIIDSTSCLVPQKELDEVVGGVGRAGLPKILSSFCKKMAQIVPNQRATVIIITHYIANTSGYGPTRMPDCGRKIQYQADTRMEVKSISPWVEGDKQIGQSVNWKILCSSIGSPGQEAQSWLRYGEGIDKIQESLVIGMEIGLISKAGAWITLDFLVESADLLPKIFPELNLEDEEAVVKACKFQGQARVLEFLKQNPEVVTKLEADMKEML
jgi:recombination protein RecA